METELAREIGRAITAALSRRGVAGTVVLRGNHAQVHAPGLEALAIELDWLEQWNLLPPEMQQKRADSAAERLHEALKAARGRSVARSVDVAALVRRAASIGVVLALAGAVVWWLSRSGFFGRDFLAPAPSQPASATPEQEERARRQRACEAGRRRLFAGADMGVDVEGWVVELWLARGAERGPLASDAALARELTKARAEFEAEASVERDDRDRGIDSAVVRMSGAFVPAFFESTRRVVLETMSEQMAKAVAADHAALFARCEHLTTRDVGAWYFGRDRQAAIAALVYAMGSRAEPPAFDGEALGDRALLQIQARVAQASAPKLDDILRRLGARQTSAAEAVAVRFAFGGPAHAVKAARELSLELGLAR